MVQADIILKTLKLEDLREVEINRLSRRKQKSMDAAHILNVATVEVSNNPDLLSLVQTS